MTLRFGSAYQCTARMSLSALCDFLVRELKLTRRPAHRSATVIWDTFDHRLYAAGGVLFRDEAEDATIFWEPERGSARVTTSPWPTEEERVFSHDLAEDKTGKELRELIAMRALLPQVRISGRSVELIQENKSGKVLARIRVHALEAGALGCEKPAKLRKRVTVEPLRGYEKAAKSIEATLMKHPDFARAKQDLVSQAYAQADLELGVYNAKPVISMAGNERADTATKRVLARNHSIMRANMSGLLADIDSEFLHDFRVAVRRSRAVIRLVKAVFPPSVTARFAADLKEIGRVTSAPRDHDVLMLTIDKYLECLPGHDRAVGESLRDLLSSDRTSGQRSLEQTLKAANYRSFDRRWAAFLAKPPPAKSSAPNAAMPIGELIRGRTWKAYRRVRAQGDNITPKSPAQSLHDLRKDCKRLRYLLGLFRSLHPQAEAKAVIGELKRLQEVLGDHQDLEAHAEMIEARGRVLQENPATPAATLELVKSLVKHLGERQDATRQLFAAAYERFLREENTERIRSLCGRPQKQKAKPSKVASKRSRR